MTAPHAIFDDGRPASLLDALRAVPAVAILRGVPASRLVDVAMALAEGGIRVLEVTLNSEGALRALEAWRTSLSAEVCIGAGTVLTVGEARDAVLAGAEFLVSPHLDERIVRCAIELGVAAVPGALTPTEIVRAAAAGATIIKVFPVAAMGGAKYISDLRASLDSIPLIAVGGVTIPGAAAYLRAGAAGVGLGTALVASNDQFAGELKDLTLRAKALTSALDLAPEEACLHD